MYPYYTGYKENFYLPQDDITRIQRLYGIYRFVCINNTSCLASVISIIMLAVYLPVCEPK